MDSQIAHGHLLHPLSDDSMNNCTYASGINVDEDPSKLPKAATEAFTCIFAPHETHKAVLDPSLMSSRDHLKPLMTTIQLSAD